MVLALVLTYFSLLTLLAVYGAHRLWMVVLYRRHARPVSPANSAPPGDRPHVTVQLPLYNERYVAERLIRSVAALRYPSDRLEIQVLDDSTDDTVEVVARVVGELREAGVDIHHLRRPNRDGFKAGALRHGLSLARGALVAVFDADFLPGADFLERSVPCFVDDQVGMVQLRWDHVNRDYSSLTQAQAVLLDGHFVVEHSARYRSGRFFNFNGTAGIWRRIAIEDAGGWQYDTLTEDLDLSYRAQQKGWHFIYLENDVVPAELPVDIAAFKSQQHRWAKGSIQTALKLLPGILDSKLPGRIKLEAFFHLTANIAYLMMAGLAVLMPLVVMVRLDRGWVGTLAMDAPYFLFATLSVCHFYVLSQRLIGRRRWQQIRYLPWVLALGVGISLNNGLAVLQAVLGHRSDFVRTPKLDITQRGQQWHTKDYVGVSRWWVQPLAELALGLWYTPAIAMALTQGGRGLLSLPFLLLFQFGFLYVSVVSIAQGWRSVRARTVAAS